ncbi:MAG: Nif3-like dinuclear metal center hexameric protein [Prevotella sp.]|nr:Nif3-like dinuclear metal center hexameric protein [Prevotella sp.]
MKIKEVIAALEQFAPLPLQEDYDNAGLQLGLTEAEVSGALLCLDVTEETVAEAVEKGCNLVVSHHPLLFRGLKQIVDADSVQRTVKMAIKNDVTIVSMHTNLDNAVGGVNWKIAERLGLEVRDTRCEMRGEKCGLYVGTFAKPLSANDFISLLKTRMEAQCVMTNELLKREIRKVAICGGAGSFMLDDAIAQGADAFVTGEMHYHEYFGHDQEIQIAVIGHYESEHFTNELFKEIIERECKGVRCVMADSQKNPVRYY